MALAAGTRLGPYEVLTPIGAGGMGEVYRATDTKLSREVAIKVLSAEVGQDPERRHQSIRTSSTRRFCCRPASVSLESLG